MRNIYDNPYKYACKCNVPYELAKIACLVYRHRKKEHRKHKPYCPVCKSKKIYYETGSYEEGYEDFCGCEECGETFAVEEIPNYENIRVFGDDFDMVLYFSTTDNKESGWLEACGATTLEEWQNFARRMIIGQQW